MLSFFNSILIRHHKTAPGNNTLYIPVIITQLEISLSLELIYETDHLGMGMVHGGAWFLFEAISLTFNCFMRHTLEDLDSSKLSQKLQYHSIHM